MRGRFTLSPSYIFLIMDSWRKSYDQIAFELTKKLNFTPWTKYCSKTLENIGPILYFHLQMQPRKHFDFRLQILYNPVKYPCLLMQSEKNIHVLYMYITEMDRYYTKWKSTIQLNKRFFKNVCKSFVLGRFSQIIVYTHIRHR